MQSQINQSQPQLTTGPRLLKLGEEIEFNFSLPSGVEAGQFSVFQQHMENADLDTPLDDGLSWLDSQRPEIFDVEFNDGSATLAYRPSQTGNHMARWTAGGEVFHRQFAVIDDDYIVLRFSSFIELESEPTLHATGIPLDYRLPVERFSHDDELFKKLLRYHRLFGDSLTPELADTPPDGPTADMTNDDRVRQYGEALEHAREALPDSSDTRSARLQFRHAIDPGYVEVFERLGLNDHFGLQEPNILPWLGMPEFPYFASETDFRKPRQESGGTVVSHTWDFCGSFHFIAPASWHYAASEGDFNKAEDCIRHGMAELRNMTEMSGHPAFANPLYDGATRNYGYPNGLFDEGYGGPQIGEFVERWQRLVAFRLTKDYKLAFARSIDIADYYRRHFDATPRTVLSSKTDHPLYDVWWNCVWGREQRVTAYERIHWQTRMSTIMKQRRSKATVSYVNLVSGKEVTAQAITKDPISSETLLVEDRHRSIRFERESPNPVWWFDYTKQESGPLGSEIDFTDTPDVDVIRSKWSDGHEHEITLKMLTKTEFADYAITIWDVPAKFSMDRSRIKTNAKDFVMAKNTDGEFHIVLFFDLAPNVELFLSVREG